MLPQTRAIRRMPGGHGLRFQPTHCRAGTLMFLDPQSRNERPAGQRPTGRPMVPGLTEGHDEVKR